jgi:23S rRNA (cytidine2498-2'-O)-methyltransferase
MAQVSAAPCLFLCDAEWDHALVQELQGLGFEQLHGIAPGWIEATPASAALLENLSVAFAEQCLFDVRRLEASSISQWSGQAGDLVYERLRDHAGPWRLHVFSRYAAGDVGHRRAALVRESLLVRLKKSQRRLLRSLDEHSSSGWRPDEALVQIGLRSPEDGCCSVTPAGLLHSLRRVVSRFSAGTVHVPAEPRAPSRAFRKLAEVEQRMDRPIAPGETCVDLGSSPGSWAWLALQRGADVVAVDRSPLRADLLQHARLTFVRGDAFKYAPPGTVDWLLSDIIAFPDRILRLLDDWLSRGRCRRFCVTIKFRGADEYPILSDFRAMLDGRNVDYVLRRLRNNRNEVTAYGVVRGAPHDVVGC